MKNIILILAVVCMLTSTTNASPITVFEMRNEQSPLIAFRIQFRTGSINDVKGKEGINALTANVIAQGGTKELTYQQVVEKLYPWAAEMDVHADKEVTTFIGNVHRDHLENFYNIFSGLLLNPRFDEQDFNRVKDDGINYLENTLRGSNDEELGKQTMQGMLYEGHPYGTTSLGTVQGLKAITLDDAKAYYKAMYSQATISIGIAGGYPKEFVEKMKKDFSQLPAGKQSNVELPKPKAISDMEIAIVDKPTRATAISFGFPIDITRADKDFYALMVANSYLGEHRTFNGLLMNHMRGERGLNYGDYSYIENFIQDGGSTFPLPNTPRREQFFSVWIRPVQPENTHFALRQAMRELKMVVENGMTKENFDATKNFLLNYSKLWVQTQSRRLGYEMDSKFYGTEFFIDRIEKELKTMSVDDVNKAIKKYLQFKNVRVAIVSGNAAEVKEKILANSDSPITYKTKVPDSILEEDKSIVNYKLNVNKDKLRVVPVKELFEK